MIDLSHLTEEEQSLILTVLKRDEELKKAEEERIRQLQKTSAPVESKLKYMTGEWFYEAKSQRHNDKIHGSEIILVSMKQGRPGASDGSLSRTERARAVSDNVSELTPPPKPARLWEAQTQPMESSESLSVSDAEKVKLNSVARSPGRPRHNPFNRASLVLEEDKILKQSTNENQEAEKSSESEPLFPLKSLTATGSSSHTPAGSLTSEGSSTGLRPVPKKRTFLSRRSQSSLTGSDISVPVQLNQPIGPKGTSTAPQGSIQHGSSQEAVDEQTQNITPFPISQKNVTPDSPTSQQLKPLNHHPFKPPNELTLVSNPTVMDREKEASSLIRAHVLTPSNLIETESSKTPINLLTDPKPLGLLDLTPVTHSDNDGHTDTFIEVDQSREGSDSLNQREFLSVDPPQHREWSDGQFLENLSSEPTTPTQHQPSQHAAFQIIEMQDKEMMRSRGVGTPFREDNFSLPANTVDQWMHHELHNSRDMPEDNDPIKTGSFKPAKRSTPLSPQPTGEEGDSIAKVLEWFSRSVDSNDWLDAQSDQPDMEEDAFGSEKPETENRPHLNSRSQQRERKEPGLKKNHTHADPSLLTQGMREEVFVFSQPEVKDVFLSESSVDHNLNQPALNTYQPKRRMSEADRLKETYRKEFKQVLLDSDEDVINRQDYVKKFNDPPAKPDGQDVKYTEEVQNETQPPKISDLKSLWEKSNSGPKILIGRSITDKALKPMEKENVRDLAEHKTVPDPELYNAEGSSRKNLRNGKSECLGLDTEQKAIGEYVRSVRPSVTLNKGVCTPERNVTAPDLEILTLPPPLDDINTPAAHSEENKTLPDDNLTSVEDNLRRSPYTVDRRGSEAEILFVSRLNPQQETPSQSIPSPQPESMSVSQSIPSPKIKADKIKQLKSFWEQEKTRPVFYTSKSKEEGEAKSNQGPLSASGKLNKRFTKSEFDLRSICDDPDNIHEEDFKNTSDKQRPNFSVLTVEQRLGKSSPGPGTNHLQFKNLCEFWGEATSRQMISTEISKIPKKNEPKDAPKSTLELKPSYDSDAYSKSVHSKSEKMSATPPSNESQPLKISSPVSPYFPLSPSSPTYVFSGNKERQHLSSSRSIEMYPDTLTDTKANLTPRIGIESGQQITSCVQPVKRASEHDITEEEMPLRPQSTLGKESRPQKPRKDSFGNSSESGPGSVLRSATSTFTFEMNEELDETSQSQPKNTSAIKAVCKADRGPFPRRSSKSSDESESLTPRARAFIPRDYRHYLGITKKSSGSTDIVPVVMEPGELENPAQAELNLGGGPVRSSTPVDSEGYHSKSGSKVMERPLGLLSNHSSTDTGQESSYSASERASSSASETWSTSRTSSNRENDEKEKNTVLKALKRPETRPRNLAKSLEDITSSMPPRQERKRAPLDDLGRSSDASTLTTPSSSLFSDPEHLKKMSRSVPSFLQKEIDDRDTDSTSEQSSHESKQKMGRSMTYLSSSSGMASVSSLSGSVMTMYSGDYGGVEVQGNIEFSINYIHRLREFHIFVAKAQDLATADAKRRRSDPYVKSYLLPDKAKLGKRKTSVKKKTVNPIFNEILRYRVRLEYLRTQTLILSVWHHDTFGRNSFLGEVDVDLSKWDFDHTQMNYLALQSRPTSSLKPSDDRGVMKLAIRFLPELSHSLGKNTLSKTGEVHIWVKDCKNLPLIGGATIDPYVKCFVLPDTSRKSRQKTRVLRRTVQPVFNHTMVYDGFKQEDLNEACVELTVWDRDRLGSNLLGGLRLGPGTGRSYGAVVDWMDSNPEEVALWEQMMTSPNEWVEGVLPLRMVTTAKKLK
ncbi:hypothetical protein UPYG_G00201070 [Umbra pygmaea]|uniref:Synaptotagmin-like protein 2 n=1 Tax=Umbra pygmaea TaxID=75934 RepID=A0ABD0WI81_UMBPY